MDGDFLAFGGFIAFVVVALAVDLFVLHRDAHKVTTREAAWTSAAWIVISLAFGALIFVTKGSALGMEFLAGYLVEKSLSIDNIFVFVLLFSFFAVPAEAQHRVLFYGVVGAQVFRAIFIFAGISLIHRFEFTVFVFGAFLVYSGITMLRSDGEPVDPANNRTLRLVRRLIPIADDYDGTKMFTRRGTVDGVPRPGRRLATPLFAVLVVVEVTDVIFAVDSIPAVLAITRDSYVAFTSNILAILGLRALYFLLAGVVGKFHLLRIGLAATLAFVGLKMLLSHYVHVPTPVSLAVIASLIGGSVWASLRWPAPEPDGVPPGEQPGGGQPGSVEPGSVEPGEAPS